MASWTRDWRRWLAPLRRNLLGKVFALVVAFVLWLFVNAGKRETQVVQFPIEFRNTPERSVLVTRERIDTVSVKLNGPERSWRRWTAGARRSCSTSGRSSSGRTCA